MDDKATLVKAMKGASAVFALTNYWESMDAEKEVKQGKNLVDAAKETGVQQFIWSSLLDVNKCKLPSNCHSRPIITPLTQPPVSGGKLPNVYHFDSKAKVEEYAREVGIPATFFLPGFFLSNLSGGNFRPTPPDNAWTLTFPISPSAPIPAFDAADTGKYIKAAVLNRDKVLGKRILGATNYTTPAEIVETFRQLFPEAGKTARYNQVSLEEFKGILKSKGMPDFAAQEMVENFQLFDEFGYYGGASLDETHALVEDKLTTWAEHAKASKKWGVELK